MLVLTIKLAWGENWFPLQYEQMVCCQRFQVIRVLRDFSNGSVLASLIMLFQAPPWCEAVSGLKVHLMSSCSKAFSIVPLLISEIAFFPFLLLRKVLALSEWKCDMSPLLEDDHNISDRKIFALSQWAHNNPPPHWWTLVNCGERRQVWSCYLFGNISHLLPTCFPLKRLHKAHLDKIFLATMLAWAIPNIPHLSLNRESTFSRLRQLTNFFPRNKLTQI